MGSPSQVPVVAFAAFFPILVNTVHGVREVPAILVRAARVMELRGGALFRKVILPASVPQVFTGLRLSVVYALTSCVGTEIIAGTDGLGFLLVDYERTFVTHRMFAVMILIALLGFGLSVSVQTTERWFLRYRT
jgi:NitT/TauT family transport system permease protein